jgi:hypothetical protein
MELKWSQALVSEGVVGKMARGMRLLARTPHPDYESAYFMNGAREGPAELMVALDDCAAFVDEFMVFRPFLERFPQEHREVIKLDMRFVSFSCLQRAIPYWMVDSSSLFAACEKGVLRDMAEFWGRNKQPAATAEQVAAMLARLQALVESRPTTVMDYVEVLGFREDEEKCEILSLYFNTFMCFSG